MKKTKSKIRHYGADDSRNYIIKKRGDQWCLMTADGSRVLGCHESREKAEEQEKAIKVQEEKFDDDELHNIEGVEIFAAGNWNGDEYSESDLDDMVLAAPEVGYVPPLKDGHHPDIPGTRALGWVKNLRRIGKKLVADFMDLPKVVYEAIKKRSYDTVSSEIFWDLSRNGKTFRRALKAVALQGAEIPAVNLRPLREIVNNEPAQTFKVINMKRSAMADDNQEEIDMDKVKEMQDRIDELTKKLEEASKNKHSDSDLEKSYKEANEEISRLKAAHEESTKALGVLIEDRRKERIKVKSDNMKVPSLRPYIFSIYDAITSGGKIVKFSEKLDSEPKEVEVEKIVDGMVEAINKSAQSLFSELAKSGGGNEGHEDDPEMEIDRRIREYREKNREASYSEAMRIVLEKDPDLAGRYAHGKR